MSMPDTLIPLTVFTQALFSSFLQFLYKAQLVLDLPTTSKLSLQWYINISSSPPSLSETVEHLLASKDSSHLSLLFEKPSSVYKHYSFSHNENKQSQNAGLKKF